MVIIANRLASLLASLLLLEESFLQCLRAVSLEKRFVIKDGNLYLDGFQKRDSLLDSLKRLHFQRSNS